MLRSYDQDYAGWAEDTAQAIEDSPSLSAKIDEVLADAYETARYDAATETVLDLDTFSVACEFANFLGS